jgi:uncharacterized protein
MIRTELEKLKPEIEEFCRKHHIMHLSLFGLALKGELGPDSDVDLLVQFHPDHIPGLFELVRMETELSQMLNGGKVDLRTAEDLSRYFRDQVVAEAEVQYETG